MTMFWKIKIFISIAAVCLLCGCTNRGAVCFTFDDFGGEDWVKADKIFKKYDAHATFLVSGRLTEKHIKVMKQLQEAGHTVGLHTLRHRNAVSAPQRYTPEKYFLAEIKPQLDICRKNGINAVAFAYPNNRHNDEFDKYLFQHFDFLRAGNGPGKKPVFTPQSQLREKMLLTGTGIGKYYKSDVNELKKLLDHAADTDSMIVFFSHKIYPHAAGVHMPVEWLEELLKHAHDRKMRIIGADEIR